MLRYESKNNSILERHCHTWVALPSRSGGSLLLFVPSWSNTKPVLPNTTPYQHWPPLTLGKPSTLVLHCRWGWEAPRWHPMRQAGVAVWSSRAGRTAVITLYSDYRYTLPVSKKKKTVASPATPAAYSLHTWVATAASARPQYRSGLQELAAPGLEKLRTCALVHSGNVGGRRDHPLPLHSAFICPFFPHSSNPLRLHPNRDTGGGGKGEKLLRGYRSLFLPLKARSLSTPLFSVTNIGTNTHNLNIKFQSRHLRGKKTTHQSIYDNEPPRSHVSRPFLPVFTPFGPSQ